MRTLQGGKNIPASRGKPLSSRLNTLSSSGQEARGKGGQVVGGKMASKKIRECEEVEAMFMSTDEEAEEEEFVGFTREELGEVNNHCHIQLWHLLQQNFSV